MPAFDSAMSPGYSWNSVKKTRSPIIQRRDSDTGYGERQNGIAQKSETKPNLTIRTDETYHSTTMNTFSPTTRFLYVLLMAFSVVMGGMSEPTLAARACSTGYSEMSCCSHVRVGECGMACCQAPEPVPQQAPADELNQLRDRSSDGKLTWVATPKERIGSAGLARRCVRSLAVPASGSPSLITQHICLQV